MSIFSAFQKALETPDKDAYFRRNSGKKILAKTTMETEEEIKQKEAEEGK